jgi:hypothetical protein
MCYTPRTSCFSWFDQPNIWWGIQVIKLRVMQCSPFPLLPRPSYATEHDPINKAIFCRNKT